MKPATRFVRLLPPSLRLIAGLPRRAVDSLRAQRFRWPLWLPVAFGAGIGVYFSLEVEPPLWWGPVVVGAALAALWRLRGRSSGAAAAALLAAGLGFLAADLRTDQVSAPALTKRTGVVEVTGRIVRRSPGGTGTRMLIAVDRIDMLPAGRTPARVRISWRGAWPNGIGPGDNVRVRAVLRPLPGPVAPGAFDFARYAFFRRIGALGFAVAPPEALALKARPGVVEAFAIGLGRMRRSLGARFEAAMPETAAAVATALVTGERGGIAETDLEALRDSGLAHLLAISGLHMMLVGGFAFWALHALLTLSERIALTRPVTKWAALAAIPVAAAYLTLSGAPISAQRAFLMFTLMMGAVLIDRRALSMRIVALTAFMILAMAPESLLEAGFQMSFAAVIALIAVYESQADRLSRRRPAVGRIDRLIDGASRVVAGICVTTAVASLATAPFAAFHFQQSVLYALPANLAAMPIFTILVMPFGLLGVALMPFGLEALPLTVMAWGIDAILAIAHTVSEWPAAAVELPALPPATLSLVALGGLWLCIWTGRVRWLGVVPVLAAIAVAAGHRQPDILIDVKGELIAVRDAQNGRFFLTRATPAFVARNWLERDGDGRAVRTAAESAPEDWRCDARGCLLKRGGRAWFAYVIQPRALDEDCGRVRILVSEAPIRGPCDGPDLVVGRFDLWRKGAHAVWLAPDGVRIGRVSTAGSARPWSPYRARMKRRSTVNAGRGGRTGRRSINSAASAR